MGIQTASDSSLRKYFLDQDAAGSCFTLFPVPNRHDSSPEFQREHSGPATISKPKQRTPAPKDHPWKISKLPATGD
jgi:hypothetical protein